MQYDFGVVYLLMMGVYVLHVPYLNMLFLGLGKVTVNYMITR